MKVFPWDAAKQVYECSINFKLEILKKKLGIDYCGNDSYQKIINWFKQIKEDQEKKKIEFQRNMDDIIPRVADISIKQEFIASQFKSSLISQAQTSKKRNQKERHQFHDDQQELKMYANEFQNYDNIQANKRRKLNNQGEFILQQTSPSFQQLAQTIHQDSIQHFTNSSKYQQPILYHEQAQNFELFSKSFKQSQNQDIFLQDQKTIIKEQIKSPLPRGILGNFSLLLSLGNQTQLNKMNNVDKNAEIHSHQLQQIPSKKGGQSKRRRNSKMQDGLQTPRTGLKASSSQTKSQARTMNKQVLKQVNRNHYQDQFDVPNELSPKAAIRNQLMSRVDEVDEEYILKFEMEQLKQSIRDTIGKQGKVQEQRQRKILAEYLEITDTRYSMCGDTENYKQKDKGIRRGGDRQYFVEYQVWSIPGIQSKRIPAWASNENGLAEVNSYYRQMVKSKQMKDLKKISDKEIDKFVEKLKSQYL
ncbi:UNKNOWN [Stylonychia lemnae]|uniref:Uncharacterized protein n=1 Tax=Stylonychia lemnae TaxID=5949 RepID=A0A078AQ79_STYLE|nr:UNKNOWN [Stylonychia lemnae]|eukprot:CDW84550.1 UNKNOWN [Stylonychia lemnae]